MKASTVLRSARSRAGLSQHELARRAGVPQPSVSRIERGVVSPSVDTLNRLLKECGSELESVPRPKGDVDRTLIRERLAMTPGDRARQVVVEWKETRAFQRAVRRT